MANIPKVSDLSGPLDLFYKNKKMKKGHVSRET